MNILEEICLYAQERVKQNCKLVSDADIKSMAEEAYKLNKESNFRFENKLKGDGLSLICEVKKASPSKGVIDSVFDYNRIALDYKLGGADCISCLTEPKWFLGSGKIFSEIRSAVTLPMLRKDFMVSSYQIYESKVLGADAVLLIMTALKQKQAQEFFEIAQNLGMTAVFECRNEEQIELAQKIGGRVIGVNNRNLKDFSVDINKAKSLRTLVDKDRVFVSESGIMSLSDLAVQKQIGADACLVGEFCMRAKDRVFLIKQMKNI